MPYSSKSQARIKKLHGVPLSLDQLNEIARQADAIGGDYAWPTAIAHFKKTHVISGGAWVKRKAEAKEATEVWIEKEDDGRFKIIAVSTSAFPDQDDETFSNKAMDYEIKESARTGVMPEFRMFHDPDFAIGKVEKMSRVGPFAVDEGHSYKDPFSLACCENILAKNQDGKWRVSRGFYALEVSGKCPTCNSGLVVSKQHMIAGFRCPTCKEVHISYKGKLRDVTFLKTRTFDDTITDIPCNKFTGVLAEKEQLEDITMMSKKQLKEKLLAANIPEDLIDERLKQVTDAQLKELGDDIPEAILKEFTGTDEGEDTGTDAVEIDQEVISAIAKEVTATMGDVVKKAVAQVLSEGIEIDIPEPNLKEVAVEGWEELKEQVQQIYDMLESLTVADKEKVAAALEDMPRNGHLRVVRMKQDDSNMPKSMHKKKMPMKGSMDDEEETGEEEEPEEKESTGIIADASGRTYENMLEFVTQPQD